MAKEKTENQDRLFTWTQLYELTRLPSAPKKKVGRPVESAFRRKLMGIYLSEDEKRDLLEVQRVLHHVLDKKPSFGEVLGILSRLYQMMISENPSVSEVLTRGYVRPKVKRIMVSFKISDGERRTFLSVQETLQAGPDLEHYPLSYGDVFVIMSSAFLSALKANKNLPKASSFIEFSQSFVLSELARGN
ncbi:MAG: hypothetical protein JW757_09915 [Anaerolineales bacterium]|nr:hypothetical protein [Anaerolineales bacterium]